MNYLKTLKSDLPASLVVFLVALPLSLGIALASGAPLNSGLIAAAIGGIVVGFLTGAPLQVSGPAAGLSVMVLGYVQHFGFEATCMITLMAGLVQVALGVMGAAQFAFIISPAVIHAMLAGIGALIALGQAQVILGFSPKGSALQNIVALAENIGNLNKEAFALGLFTLSILFFWQKVSPQKLKAVPASLVAVVVGTVGAFLLKFNVPHVSLTGSLLGTLPKFQGLSGLKPLIVPALGMAFVASAESLLCAVATDKLHSGARVNLKKELVAQGIGNSVSGILGGLPITGVIVRSSANVASGAKTKLSTILHGGWVLLFALTATSLLNQIPLSVLAALLVFTGLKLIKISEYQKLTKFKEGSVYLLTFCGVVFVNLLWGIGIGFAASLMFTLMRMAKFDIDVDQTTKDLQVKIKGSLSFIGVPRLIKKLNSLPKGQEVKLDFSIYHIDHSAIDALRSWKDSYEQNGGTVKKTSLDMLWKELQVPSELRYTPNQFIKNYQELPTRKKYKELQSNENQLGG